MPTIKLDSLHFTKKSDDAGSNDEIYLELKTDGLNARRVVAGDQILLVHSRLGEGLDDRRRDRVGHLDRQGRRGSGGERSDAPGPGARSVGPLRRGGTRESRTRENALRWWKRPGVLPDRTFRGVRTHQRSAAGVDSMELSTRSMRLLSARRAAERARYS